MYSRRELLKTDRTLRRASRRSSENTTRSKIPFCRTPVGLGIRSLFRKGFAAQATRSWQPPAPGTSTETGWGAALMQNGTYTIL